MKPLIIISGYDTSRNGRGLVTRIFRFLFTLVKDNGTMRQRSLRALLTTFFLCTLVLGPLLSREASAGPALDRLRTTVNQALEILKSGQAGETRRNMLRQTLLPRFDFPVMARSALGHNWNSFNPAQKDQFVKLFQRLMENNYIDKIESYQQAQVQFISEVPQNDRVVLVTSVVHSSGQQHSMDYRLIARQGDWRVFDIVIEGVGLITNYRSQFSEILAQNGPDGLISMLRTKVGG
jgi:phospholipid transport system substrate-binding protein